MKQIFALIAALTLSACATTQSQTAETAATLTDADGNVIRCERVSGSRLPGQRVCRTEAEWARIQESGRELVREIQRSPQQSPR